MDSSKKYLEYFEIDDQYFPCVDDAAIDSGKVDWTDTYPHDTFIDLLKNVERMLSRTNNHRSIWIHGAYGTGKSRCAWTLKNILEVSEKELKAYWDKYKLDKKYSDLLGKFLGHKKDKKIIVAHRYASGSINSTHDLLMAVQNSLKSALEKAHLSYLGENTLKDAVIAWIKKPEQKNFFNSLLQKSTYKRRFAQSNADEVLNELCKGDIEKLPELMGNIFYLAEKEGITAFEIDTDGLKEWICDVIEKNGLKALVLVWDEFSDYFKNNRTSLSEFQKLAVLCQDKPFYFVVVTHETGSLITEADPSWKIVRDRFEFSEISLPNSIAFNLIQHALKIKSAVQSQWAALSKNLNSRLTSSRKAVAAAADIFDMDVLKDIVPIHPMAVLLLKNIATAFSSNQRSMFDFIKKKDDTEDTKSFQWFIEKYGPDDQAVLTIDLLWNFFYEKGKKDLSLDIRAILDTYPRQKNLTKNEQAVLKTILMMQAIDQRLGGSIELFKTTEKNVALAFEGVDDLEGGTAVNIAKKLVRDQNLYNKPIGEGTTIFASASIAGDQAQIDNEKKNLRETVKTAQLSKEGELVSALSLGPALTLRYEITAVTIDDFTRTINGLREKNEVWKFQAVIAFAKDDGEAAAFRKSIKQAVSDQSYARILFIDALSSTLGMDNFEQYVDYAALSKYHSGKDNNLATEMNRRAVDVLSAWKDGLANNKFLVYSFDNKQEKKCPNAQAVLNELKENVGNRFKDAFDFTQTTIGGKQNKLSEAQFKPSQLKSSAIGGINQQTKGIVAGIEQILLPTVWKVDKYWETKTTLSVSKIKIRIENLINSAFEKDGYISIRDIYDILMNEYGFAPCNLYAFLSGFLLKEYAVPPYRYADSNGANEEMNADKLAEMLKNYIDNQIVPNNKYKDTYIQKLRPEDKAFFELTERVFKIPQSQCSSPEQAATQICLKMKELAYPFWCLCEIDDYGVTDIIHKVIFLVQKGVAEAAAAAREIGKTAITRQNLGDELSLLVTRDNCQRGMQSFLLHFEGGELLSLAKEIGAEPLYLEEIRNRFSVKHSCYWEQEGGEDEIRKLIVEYKVVRESNNILGENINSKNNCFSKWREHLRHITISHESVIMLSKTIIKDFFEILENTDFLPERMNGFLNSLMKHRDSIKNFFTSQEEIFSQTYKPYLDGLNSADIRKIMSGLQPGMFMLSKIDCNKTVKEQADLQRQNQLNTKLRQLWRDKTGSKDPKEWSNHYRTPVLCLVPNEFYSDAKKAFDTLNRPNPSEAEVSESLRFLENAAFLTDLNDAQKRDTAFEREIIGKFAAMLPIIDEVRDYLDTKLSIELYEWYGNPSVKSTLEAYAKTKYEAGGSDKALQKIDSMDSVKLKEYLKRLVKDNMAVGIEIIINEGK